MRPSSAFPRDRARPPHLRRIYAALLVLATLAGPGSARGLELFDFEPPYLVDSDKTIKDHSLIRIDGEWHAFYIRGTQDTGTSTEDALGHAVSTDLHHWAIRNPAIQAGPEPWDERNVWAPYVLQDGNGWTMFYTGADNNVVQRMGTAFTSTSGLVGWWKLPNPALEPDPLIYEWDPGIAFSSFRDPFVFEKNGAWHVLNTAVVIDSTLAAGRRGAIHHATSTDLVNWTPQVPLALHNGPDNAAWHEIESVQLREVGNFWHLTYTETNVQGVQHLRSSEFDSGWDFNSTILLDQGVAAELTPTDNPRKFVFTRHVATPHINGDLFWVIRADSLGIDPVTDQPSVIKDASLDIDWPVRFGTAFLAAPTFGDNATERSEAATNLRGNGMVSSREFYSGPLSGFGAPGAQLGGGATGLMQSRTFTLQGGFIRLLVGGGGDPACGVSLVDAGTFATLASANGTGTHVMSEVLWDVTAHVGKQVYLQIEDNATGVDGYINVDHIEELLAIVGAPPAPRAPGGRLLPNRPNPFNPRTELRFELAARGTAHLTIHDARGRLVASLPPQRLDAGRHSRVWTGTDAQGREVASGIYLVRLSVDGHAHDSQRITLVR